MAAFLVAAPDMDLDDVLAPLLRTPTMASPGSVSRRQLLSSAGGLGALAFLAACSSKASTAASTTTTAAQPVSTVTTISTTSVTPSSGATPAASTAATTASAVPTTAATATPGVAVLAAEMTEGPYWLDLNLVRSDIREDQQGAPLTMKLAVVDVATGKPIEGANVDIWHCSAEGIYSGFTGDSVNDKTFLRGIQPTDKAGVATFTTIYPGWYQGRTVHIHAKVNVGGKTIHTGQLFFDDAYTDTVFKDNAPYSNRSARKTRNTNDGIFNGGGAGSIFAITKDDKGYAGSMTMGVQTV